MGRLLAILLAAIICISFFSFIIVRMKKQKELLASPNTEPFTLSTTLPESVVNNNSVSGSDAVSGFSIPSDSFNSSDLRNFFLETVLGSAKPNDNIVNRWASSIRYYVSGNYTEDDLKTILEVCSILNDTPDFPGITEAPDVDEANFNIRFISESELKSSFNWTESEKSAYSAGLFKSNSASGEINLTVIGIVAGAPVAERRTAIFKEMLKGCGIGYTSEIYRDSLFYPSSKLSEPSEADRILLDLLYSKSLLCGSSFQKSYLVVDSLLK